MSFEEELRMPKGLAPHMIRKNIQKLPIEKQWESVERGLRVLPYEINREENRDDIHYNPKVIKYLKSVYHMYEMYYGELLAND